MSDVNLFARRQPNILFRKFYRGQVISWSVFSESEIIVLVNSVSGGLSNPNPIQDWFVVNVTRRQLTKIRFTYNGFENVKKAPEGEVISR